MDAGQIEAVGSKYCARSELCHGIGHILYIVLNDFAKATSACDTISNHLALDACLRGVFMQGIGGIGGSLAVGSVVTTPHAKVAKDDYGYPCDSVTEKYRHACYTYLPAFENESLKNQPQNSATKLHVLTQVCESLTEPSRAYCFEGIGRYNGSTLSNAKFKDPTNRPLCESFPLDTDKESCVLGRIRYPVLHTKNPPLLAYCSQLKEPGLQDFCFRANFEYEVGTSTVTAYDACTGSLTQSLCEAAFGRYENIRDTLPDYQFGLYGEKK